MNNRERSKTIDSTVASMKELSDKLEQLKLDVDQSPLDKVEELLENLANNNQIKVEQKTQGEITLDNASIVVKNLVAEYDSYKTLENTTKKNYQKPLNNSDKFTLAKKYLSYLNDILSFCGDEKNKSLEKIVLRLIETNSIVNSIFTGKATLTNENIDVVLDTLRSVTKSISEIKKITDAYFNSAKEELLTLSNAYQELKAFLDQLLAETNDEESKNKLDAPLNILSTLKRSIAELESILDVQTLKKDPSCQPNSQNPLLVLPKIILHKTLVIDCIKKAKGMIEVNALKNTIKEEIFYEPILTEEPGCDDSISRVNYFRKDDDSIDLPPQINLLKKEVNTTPSQIDLVDKQMDKKMNTQKENALPQTSKSVGINQVIRSKPKSKERDLQIFNDPLTTTQRKILLDPAESRVREKEQKKDKKKKSFSSLFNFKNKKGEGDDSSSEKDRKKYF